MEIETKVTLWASKADMNTVLKKQGKTVKDFSLCYTTFYATKEDAREVNPKAHIVPVTFVWKH